MIVNEEEALARINSPDNLTNKLVEIRKLYTNRDGKKLVPPMVQDLIGVTSALTTQKDAAAAFGVSQPQAGYYEKGKHKNSNVATKLMTVHEAALEAMISSIKGINEKIPSVKKAETLSMIAANMSRVIEKTSPKEKSTSNIQVVVYAPRVKDEHEYESIEA